MNQQCKFVLVRELASFQVLRVSTDLLVYVLLGPVWFGSVANRYAFDMKIGMKFVDAITQRNLRYRL